MKPGKKGATAQAAHGTSSTTQGAANNPKAKAKDTKPKKKTPNKITASQRDFLARLQHLRSVAQEISQVYLANLEHDIMELIDLISDAGKRGGQRAGINSAVIEQMTEILEQISVKPEKGRRKDLKKIEEAVEAIRQLVAKKRGTRDGGG